MASLNVKRSAKARPIVAIIHIGRQSGAFAEEFKLSAEPHGLKWHDETDENG